MKYGACSSIVGQGTNATSHEVAGSVPNEGVCGFFFFFFFFLGDFGPGVDSASNRNEYQDSSWELKRDRRVRSVSQFLKNVGSLMSHNSIGLHSLLHG
jgi:hypothetical protein